MKETLRGKRKRTGRVPNIVLEHRLKRMGMNSKIIIKIRSFENLNKVRCFVRYRAWLWNRKYVTERVPSGLRVYRLR